MYLGGVGVSAAAYRKGVEAYSADFSLKRGIRSRIFVGRCPCWAAILSAATA